jgi:hypothetical protein
MEILV